jgi:fructokinase
VIVVCGEALIDIIPAGDGTRRPVPGGGPFNTARAVARLGAPTSFLGRLSTDAFGVVLARELATDGADLSLVSYGPEPTTLAVAELDGDGLAEYEFYVHGTSAPNLTLEMVPAKLPAAVGALHIGTLGLVLEPMATTLTEVSRRESEHRLLMLDPNVRPQLVTDAEKYRRRLDGLVEHSTIVKASEGDLAWLYPQLDCELAARRMLDLGARLVLVTLGAEGALAVSSLGTVRVAAPKVEVVDTIGAGDAFGAAVLAWLHDHDSLRPDLALDREGLESMLGFACLVAAITCTRAGADPPWRAELAKGTAGAKNA